MCQFVAITISNHNCFTLYCSPTASLAACPLAFHHWCMFTGIKDIYADHQEILTVESPCLLPTMTKGFTAENVLAIDTYCRRLQHQRTQCIVTSDSFWHPLSLQPYICEFSLASWTKLLRYSSNDQSRWWSTHGGNLTLNHGR